MKIFLAGGAGIIGTRLVPRLAAAGHQVTATTRRPEKLSQLAELGADGVVVDVYDKDRLTTVVADSNADLVIHELTDLSDYDTAANARLRREGTANLVAAAQAADIQRIIVQSIAWVFPDGETPATEEDKIIPGSAVEDMERLARAIPQSTVLRYGMFYGPDTWYAPGGRIATAVEAESLPATPAITSFVHIDDAVAATVEAIGWPVGTYHVVDDEPAAGVDWLPVYAASIGAPTPPTGPIADGAPTGRAISNAKARAVGWTPQHLSWRQGFNA